MAYGSKSFDLYVIYQNNMMEEDRLEPPNSKITRLKPLPLDYLASI